MEKVFHHFDQPIHQLTVDYFASDLTLAELLSSGLKSQSPWMLNSQTSLIIYLPAVSCIQSSPGHKTEAQYLWEGHFCSHHPSASACISCLKHRSSKEKQLPQKPIKTARRP